LIYPSVYWCTPLYIDHIHLVIHLNYFNHFVSWDHAKHSYAPISHHPAQEQMYFCKPIYRDANYSTLHMSTMLTSHVFLYIYMYVHLRNNIKLGAKFANTQAKCVLDRQPTKGVTRGRWLWPRRDRKIEGETRGTQFRQVWAAMCVIPYVLYVT
jgi:hypothetical protein